jgi:4-alpha-glucanotransferase
MQALLPHSIRESGILLHPSSLPGPYGCGDLGAAAYQFVDWLASAGQAVWQVLPLGGIGPGNSPYMSSSAFAGNVLLIDLLALQERGWLLSDECEADPRFSAERVCFGAVVPHRMRVLALAAQRFQEQASRAERESFRAFGESQAAWLADYTLFMSLSEHFVGLDWPDWDAPLAKREPSALAAARSDLADRTHFWAFTQWCFFEQWQALRQYAHAHGVQIMGDAPIFIAHHSADVWARPELFELDANGRQQVVAGVPPDAFSETGQRWGNPLYRWSTHAQEGFAWWIARIRHAFVVADRLRIDHFRGFAAYWEIPASEPTAMQGRWVPGPGAALFEAIQQALGTLPILAEDLGLITPDVIELRKAFALPGMRVLQFAFDGDPNNCHLPEHHEPDTVAYTGTHDNNTSQGWWNGLPEHQREHVRRQLHTDGQNIHWDMIQAAYASVAQLAIVPLQDVLGSDGAHRMNFPGQADGHWEWRFSSSIWNEALQAEHAERLADLVRVHDRGELMGVRAKS